MRGPSETRRGSGATGQVPPARCRCRCRCQVPPARCRCQVAPARCRCQVQVPGATGLVQVQVPGAGARCQVPPARCPRCTRPVAFCIRHGHRPGPSITDTTRSPPPLTGYAQLTQIRAQQKRALFVRLGAIGFSGRKRVMHNPSGQIVSAADPALTDTAAGLPSSCRSPIPH